MSMEQEMGLGSAIGNFFARKPKPDYSATSTPVSTYKADPATEAILAKNAPMLGTGYTPPEGYNQQGAETLKNAAGAPGITPAMQLASSDISDANLERRAQQMNPGVTLPPAATAPAVPAAFGQTSLRAEPRGVEPSTFTPSKSFLPGKAPQMQTPGFKNGVKVNPDGTPLIDNRAFAQGPVAGITGRPQSAPRQGWGDMVNSVKSAVARPQGLARDISGFNRTYSQATI